MPLCRKDFKYTLEDKNKRRALGLQNKYNSPSVQQNYIERTRINDFNNYQFENNFTQIEQEEELIEKIIFKLKILES